MCIRDSSFRTTLETLLTFKRLISIATGGTHRLAWQKNTSGSRPVQVTLRGPNGETLSSLVVTTSLSSGFNPEGAAEKMLDAAVAVRRLAISVAE